MNFPQWQHYLRGLLFETFKKRDQAIAEYRQSLHHNPQFAQAARCLGYLHASRQEYNQAEEYFQRALALDPDADVWFNLGYIREAAGRKEEAIAAFHEAVRLKPSLDRAWYGMGLARAALGRHEEAAQALEQATVLQPMNGHAWYALGMAYHHSHRPEKVKEVAEHISRFDPQMTRRLVQEAERSDLTHLIRDIHS